MLLTADPSDEILIVRAGAERRRSAVVDITIPAYNEAETLEASVRRLHEYLRDQFPLPWLLTIADNGSMDRSWGIACRLASELDGVQAIRLEQKGRGRALRAAWTASPAPVVAYMDVDLSTDLDALLPLVAPLVSGHSDIAIGTRLASGAHVARGPRREAISRSYNLLLRATLRSGFSDAQCGFKALRADVAHALLPMIEDEGWFFDTELLVLAERNGLRIHEVPVDWADDQDSRVDVVDTAKGDLRGIWRMLRRVAQGDVSLREALPGRDARTPESLGGQLVRFGSIGVVSTIVFAVLFALLVGPLGPLGADIVALGSCALANTAANRRVTFALRGPTDRARHYGAGLVLAGLPLLLTLMALGLLEAAGVTSIPVLLAVTTVLNGAASLGRFVVLR
ncbi:MAG: glycosyltransferase, partial [Actinomycetota bacterium]|nr:glycosyltransferase [Actinomycetota bacterium]